MIDTSVAVALFRRDPGVEKRLAQIYGVLSTIVLGELYFGALRATLTTKEMNYIARLMQTSRIIVCDEVTSFQYATIRNHLRQQASPIPENDMWIAASALQHSLPLATRDGHFDRVPGLVVERW